jgi:site-specific DNA-cytosine methylase
MQLTFECRLQIRNDMVFSLVEAISFFQPDFAVVEQVKTALCRDNGIYASTLQGLLLKHNYQSRIRVLRADNYGAPQTRERMILVASRRGLPLPPFPAPFCNMENKKAISSCARSENGAPTRYVYKESIRLFATYDKEQQLSTCVVF